jgi:hypothetical protein
MNHNKTGSASFLQRYRIDLHVINLARTALRQVLGLRVAPLTRTNPRLCLIASNRNHVNIFQQSAAVLKQRGLDVVFATIEGHADQPLAASALKSLEWPYIDISQLLQQAVPGDVVCVGNDWGPKRLVKVLDQLKTRGIKLIGVVEGARFAFPRQYTRVDEILCWGPSGGVLLQKPLRIVGSPIIEKAARLKRARADRPRVLINYKFSYGAEDHGFVWGAAAIAAAKLIDSEYVLSTHPASQGVPADVQISHEPFSALLASATLLVTRSSTVIYEALAAGVSVIYFPLTDEKRAEFADPKGAFPTAESAEELLALTKTHAAAPQFDSGRAAAFLDWHVSIDPARAAVERLADALADIVSVASGSQFPHIPSQRVQIEASC